MGRNYWINGPSTEADGDSFDACTARIRMVGNAEAVYEEARIDQCVILQAPENADSLYEPIMGPVPIVIRYDRGGGWRTQYVNLLCCGGTGTPTLRLVLTDVYRWPYGDPVTGIGTIDPYVNFTPGSGSTVAWQTAQEITIPDRWVPGFHDEGSATTGETGRTFHAWCSVWIATTPAATYGKVAGFRIYESVELEA